MFLVEPPQNPNQHQVLTDKMVEVLSRGTTPASEEMIELSIEDECILTPWELAGSAQWPKTWRRFDPRITLLMACVGVCPGRGVVQSVGMLAIYMFFALSMSSLETLEGWDWLCYPSVILVMLCSLEELRCFHHYGAYAFMWRVETQARRNAIQLEKDMVQDRKLIGEIRAHVMDARAGGNHHFAKARQVITRLKIQEHKHVFETYVEDAIRRHNAGKSS